MELIEAAGNKYKVTEAEVGRARLGAFLLGTSLEARGTELTDEHAVQVLGGNIVLLQHLGDVAGQGITHFEELKDKAAKDVRSGIVALGLDQD